MPGPSKNLWPKMANVIYDNIDFIIAYITGKLGQVWMIWYILKLF